MNKLLGIFPRPQPMRNQSRVYDLKARLDWGEPALTIIDVRDRSLFNESHVMGAISLPTAELVNRVIASLEFDRDLYIYAETDEEAEAAAAQLRGAGYEKVSILRGGVAAWKAAGFPVEATSAIAA
ncbi:MAG: rhodanese-like domain-containing protein [Leptolyngbyaceae cyanobacterium]